MALHLPTTGPFCLDGHAMLPSGPRLPAWLPRVNGHKRDHGGIMLLHDSYVGDRICWNPNIPRAMNLGEA